MPGSGAVLPSIRPAAQRVCAAGILAVFAAACGGAAAAAPPEEARAMFDAGSRFEPVPVALDNDEYRRVRDRADVRVKLERIRAWRVAGGGEPGWLFIDQVIGKHEFITYALAVGGDGRVRGLEVLEYLESYGGEIQRPSWRAQFYGKSLASDIFRLSRDIDNIAGATLSSRNVTDGVRKLLVLHDALLRKSGGPGS